MKKGQPERWYGWQKDALESFQTTIPTKSNFLAAVSGGGGKTWFAIEAAARMFEADLIDRVIVVTHTSHLVRQWDKTASIRGLRLLAVAGNAKLKKNLPADAQGYICTFAALGRMPDLHEVMAAECRTLVIFDEIHHLGDEDEEGKCKWGDGAKRAFRPALYRLALSGTPFRANAQRIPFVHYEPVDGSNTISEVMADFTYSYGKAVADDVCRRVVFHEVDGPIEWTRSDRPDVILRSRFAERLDDKLWGDRLRFAISFVDDDKSNDNALLCDLLKRANNKLMDIRKAGHADAAGLYVAGSITEAKLAKQKLKELTGHRAIIVHNEEERSLEAIQSFRGGIEPWIISVRMITEGVDIPRLRVCVYATNVIEELFVMQVIFRIVRHSEHPYGESHFFYPADERLVKIAKKVEEEIKVRLDERERDERDSGPERKLIEKDFVGAEAEAWQATAAGERFTEDDIYFAEEWRSQHPEAQQIDIVSLAKFCRAFRKRDEQAEVGGEDVEPYNDKRDELRSKIQRAVGRLHYITRKPHNEWHIYLNDAVGARDKETATIEQLQKMLVVAMETIAGLNGDGSSNDDDDDDGDF